MLTEVNVVGSPEPKIICPKFLSFAQFFKVMCPYCREYNIIEGTNVDGLSCCECYTIVVLPRAQKENAKAYCIERGRSKDEFMDDEFKPPWGEHIVEKDSNVKTIDELLEEDQ